MKTFKITIAYDGTGFVGWQRQASGPSIQGLLEEALHDLDARRVIVHGAGRTDAGVHAIGQVASFRLHREIEPPALLRALNARLPATIRVRDAAAVPDTFHARFHATRKRYRYRIWNGDVLSPFERHFAWHVTAPLDATTMAAAAASIEGRRDFAAFRAAGGTTTTTDREVFSFRVAREAAVDRAGTGSLIVCEIAGSGFLRHMVRNLVGSLVEIGRGRRPLEWMSAVLEGRDRGLAGPTAPAHGLVLVAVDYGLQSPVGTEDPPPPRQ